MHTRLTAFRGGQDALGTVPILRIGSFAVHVHVHIHVYVYVYV
jgi:hypothetical protein